MQSGTNSTLDHTERVGGSQSPRGTIPNQANIEISSQQLSKNQNNKPQQEHATKLVRAFTSKESRSTAKLERGDNEWPGGVQPTSLKSSDLCSLSENRKGKSQLMRITTTREGNGWARSAFI
jgi:hypothetical protein